MRFGLFAFLLTVLLVPSSAPPALAVDDSDLPVLAPGDWQFPVVGTVVRRFDPPPEPWLAGHRGVDIAAAESTVVTAAGSGIVAFAGMVAGRPVVSIDHPNGTRTTYEPVRPMVSAHDVVSTGAPIGILLAGHHGCATACLHWGLKRGDTYLDPLALFGLARVRLLPVRPRRQHRPLRLVSSREQRGQA